MKLLASALNRRIRIERNQRPAGRGKAGQESWTEVATVSAQIQDVLPSRGERLAEGMSITTRPARVRIRYRTDITSDMRIVYGARIMQIVSAPAELGFREGLELLAQDYSTGGTGV